MGGFLGIGGSSAKTDRKTALTGFSDLSNVFNFGMGAAKSSLDTGTKTTQTGLDALLQGKDFFSKLVTGDRTAGRAAVAPEINAALASQDAAKRQRATMGTARGGGTAGAEQTSADRVMAEIDNFLFGVRPAAAKEVAEIGGKISDVGLTERGQALGFAGLSERSAADLTSLATESRKLSYAINQDTVAKVTKFVEDVLAGAGLA